MMTIRQIERQWEAKEYERLFANVVSTRPEAGLKLGIDATRPVSAAAMAIIRLDELDQSHVRLYSKLVRALLAAKEADGGWGDVITTSMCVRALLCGDGKGMAIERGLTYLSELQKAEGIWPNVPIRRMPADPYISALVLYQLGTQPRFRQAVRLADAVHWFSANEGSLDNETRDLWRRARLRCRFPKPTAAPSLC